MAIDRILLTIPNVFYVSAVSDYKSAGTQNSEPLQWFESSGIEVAQFRRIKY